jgi:hypothetical protein
MTNRTRPCGADRGADGSRGNEVEDGNERRSHGASARFEDRRVPARCDHLAPAWSQRARPPFLRVIGGRKGGLPV